MLIPIAQIAVSAILIVFILLQQRASGGAGGIFGGGGGEGYYQARRGFEKAIFYGTIVLAVVFIALAILNFLK